MKLRFVEERQSHQDARVCRAEKPCCAPPYYRPQHFSSWVKYSVFMVVETVEIICVLGIEFNNSEFFIILS